MTQEELKLITLQREQRTIEYKEAYNELPSNLFDTVCAFLNRDGGVIVLGVHDDGTVTDGVNPRAVDQMCKNIANISNNPEQLKPTFLLQPEPVEWIDKAGKKQVIVIQVPASSQVHRFKNRIFDRSVDGDFELRTDAEISALYLRKSTEYSENRIFPYLRLEDLRSESIDLAKTLMKNLRPDHPWLNLSIMDMLKQANLYRRDLSSNQEGFTLAALMLFGKTEVIQSALPYYRVDAVVRLNDVDRYDDRLEVFGNIVDAYTELMDFMAKHLPDPFYMEGDLRMSLRDKIFREIIANMLVHREYLNPTPSIIEITRKGIIAKNANRPLKAGQVTLANYERHPKNPHMANFFVQIGRAEHLGTGIRNIYKYVPLYTGKQPIIDDENIYAVRMALPTVMTAEEVHTALPKTTPNSERSIVESIVENIVEKLPTMRGKIVKILWNNPSASASSIAKEVGIAQRNVQEHLKQLQAEGIIRRIGPAKGGHWEIITPDD